MAKNQFTPEQQEVINNRGNNLLVSAAAGSGKTTVMIERIKDLIVKEKVPIENFLVVTFTKASSIDMKARLISKLSTEEPTPFLIEQIDSINTADVSNLHSFCARLLKSYFYEAGLDPSFIVLSDEETQVLKEKALNILFEQEFDNQNKDFFELLDVLQKNRSDKELRNNILKLHEFFNVIFDKDKWFSGCIKSLYNSDLNKNQACNIINGYVCSRIEKLFEQVEKNILLYNELGLKDFVVYLQEMQSQLLKIRMRNGFVKNAQNIFEIATFSAPPKVDEAFAERRASLDAFRGFINKEIKNFQANYISNNQQMLVEELSKAKKLATTLYYSAIKFGDIYAQLKKDKGGLDYNDLEQYTLKVLENPEILDSLKQKYKYVFVDEYQDINAVQEKIISMLSGNNNRFMVGDIKQSIYRFRLCDPDIFLNKYNAYKTEQNSKSIDLSKNFRSNRHILNFVNMVFNHRMTESFGGIDYHKTAQLVAGATFEEDNPVTLSYINTQDLQNKKLNTNAEIDAVYSVKNHTQTEEVENLKSKAEGTYIANEILDLVANKTIFDSKLNNNRPIRFKDIAVLIPARNDFLENLLEIFANNGIPASTDASEDVLSDRYVKSVYNYLKLMYNYKQDIELFSVLYSPLSDFSLNELAQLRVLEPDCRFFYQCLENCCKNSQLSAKLAKKLQNFVQKLNKYRRIAGYKTVKDVVNQLIADFNLVNIILTEADGHQRINLLNKFIESLPSENIYQYFSEGSLATINAEKTSDVNAVQIVTIHKSKGLEYPIAFVANIGRQFNMQSLHGNMLISKELGLAIDYFNQTDRYKNVTLAKEAIKLTETRKTIEEQQRLLYVALTRAINKLYVVGCSNIEKLHSEFPERQSSFADWFDSFVYNYINGTTINNVNIQISNAADLIENETNKEEIQILLGEQDSQLKQLVEENITYQYPNYIQTKTPQKTSVTQIASGYHESEEVYLRYNSTNTQSSIEKGNAYHKFMQFVGFESNTIDLLKQDVQYMLNSGKITKEELSLVNMDSILKLLNSNEFKDIVLSGKVLREKEFFMKMGKDEIQIVQGVVDLAVISNTGIIIVDYKTGIFKQAQKLSQYSKQIDLYSSAMEKSFGKKVVKRAIVGIEHGEVYFI